MTYVEPVKWLELYDLEGRLVKKMPLFPGEQEPDILCRTSREEIRGYGREPDGTYRELPPPASTQEGRARGSRRGRGDVGA